MEKQYDVIIVGTGAAGLYAALNFPDDVSVLLISKRELELSNSSLAQGGVAACSIWRTITTSFTSPIR